MNKINRLNVFFAVIVLCGAILALNAAVDDTAIGKPQTVKIDSTTNTIKIHATTNTVRIQPLATSSLVTGNSSAVSELVSPLANRRKIIFRVNTASKELTVNVGGAVATAGTGLVVTSVTPLELDAGPNIAISYVASEVFSIAIAQMGY